MLGAERANFKVRVAAWEDLPVLVRHPYEMFKDMGQLRDDAYEDLAQASAPYFEGSLANGEYVAWLVCPADKPKEVIAGGGVQLR